MKSLTEIIQSSSNNKDLKQQQELSPSTQSRLLERFPTLRDFSLAYNPIYLERFSRFPTRCIMGTAPTLIDLNLSYSPNASIAWLIAQLTAFQEQINVPNKMSVQQTDSCAQNIAHKFGYLKTSEIMLFLARLKGGLYSIDWYGYVTPDRIIEALREYFMPYRNDILYKMEKQQQDKLRKEALNNPNNITWEEYCKMKGIDKPSPLDNGKQ